MEIRQLGGRATAVAYTWPSSPTRTRGHWFLALTLVRYAEPIELGLSVNDAVNVLPCATCAYLNG